MAKLVNLCWFVSIPHTCCKAQRLSNLDTEKLARDWCKLFRLIEDIEDEVS
jgi:hypothetical protein